MLQDPAGSVGQIFPGGLQPDLSDSEKGREEIRAWWGAGRCDEACWRSGLVKSGVEHLWREERVLFKYRMDSHVEEEVIALCVA